MIRTLSRRGTYNTVTFTDDQLMPSFLRRNKGTAKQGVVPEKVSILPIYCVFKRRIYMHILCTTAIEYLLQVCVITGLVAKYKDPVTGLPYANLQAYREIRKKFPDKKLPDKKKNPPAVLGVRNL